MNESSIDMMSDLEFPFELFIKKPKKKKSFHIPHEMARGKDVSSLNLSHFSESLLTWGSFYVLSTIHLILDQ